MTIALTVSFDIPPNLKHKCALVDKVFVLNLSYMPAGIQNDQLPACPRSLG